MYQNRITPPITLAGHINPYPQINIYDISSNTAGHLTKLNEPKVRKTLPISLKISTRWMRLPSISELFRQFLSWNFESITELSWAS